MTGIQIAKVSAVQKDTGMVSVVYPDQEGSATDYLPFLSCGQEYHLPDIDDVVLVAALSDGIHSAVVLGGLWNRENRPKDPGADWSKELAAGTGMSVRDGVLTIRARDIRFETEGGTVSLADLEGGWNG